MQRPAAYLKGGRVRGGIHKTTHTLAYPHCQLITTAYSDMVIVITDHSVYMQCQDHGHRVIVVCAQPVPFERDQIELCAHTPSSLD